MQSRLIFLSILFTTLGILSCPAQQKTTVFSGKVVDRSSGQPVAYATVMVADNTTKQGISGTTTLEDGSFVLETNATDFYLEISFIGYQKKI
ncbi:MAG: carboxypeptidase-like regulatory domain-containing protein, partial [Allomuricauda sp.]